MKLWKAKILCGCIEDSGHKAKESVLEVLVSAETVDEAILAAQDFADSTAPIGPKWIYFKYMQCASLKVPCALGKHKTIRHYKVKDMDLESLTSPTTASQHE